jgi:hypothetical protein
MSSTKFLNVFSTDCNNVWCRQVKAAEMCNNVWCRQVKAAEMYVISKLYQTVTRNKSYYALRFK